MVLFATDIAARGLDFPTVDWVVQVRGAIHHPPLLCHVVERLLLCCAGQARGFGPCPQPQPLLT